MNGGPCLSGYNPHLTIARTGVKTAISRPQYKYWPHRYISRMNNNNDIFDILVDAYMAVMYV